jgi:iron(II)-dependent oxidoreductase
MVLTEIASGKSRTTIAQLIKALKETRARTLELVDDLSEAQLVGPRLQVVNPLRWEIGHLAWFQEFWVLRHLGGQPPILKQGDELYDSARVAHDTRWELPLLEREETLVYMQQVLERVIDQAGDNGGGLTDAEGYDQEYFLKLVLLHEQMHDEAITYTRQTLGYSAPAIAAVNKVHFANQDAPSAQAHNDPAANSFSEAHQNKASSSTTNS